ncbi:hypothetical protein DRN74_06120 [Candidatus Micrarchaeota archaeon]|nr:MAG: hypothetical protein DRN74_06120 [Candidatus Micrarchaeota archaeon]
MDVFWKGQDSRLAPVPTQRTGLFTKRGKGIQEAVPQKLGELIADLREFLLPPLQPVTTGKEFHRVWPPRSPWAEPSG